MYYLIGVKSKDKFFQVDMHTPDAHLSYHLSGHVFLKVGFNKLDDFYLYFLNSITNEMIKVKDRDTVKFLKEYYRNWRIGERDEECVIGWEEMNGMNSVFLFNDFLILLNRFVHLESMQSDLGYNLYNSMLNYDYCNNLAQLCIAFSKFSFDFDDQYMYCHCNSLLQLRFRLREGVKVSDWELDFAKYNLLGSGIKK